MIYSTQMAVLFKEQQLKVGKIKSSNRIHKRLTSSPRPHISRPTNGVETRSQSTLSGRSIDHHLPSSSSSIDSNLHTHLSSSVAMRWRHSLGPPRIFNIFLIFPTHTLTGPQAQRGPHHQVRCSSLNVCGWSLGTPKRPQKYFN